MDHTTSAGAIRQEENRIHPCQFGIELFKQLCIFCRKQANFRQVIVPLMTASGTRKASLGGVIVAQRSRKPKKTKPAISSILKYLINKYYLGLSLTKAPQHFEAEAKALANRPEYFGQDLTLTSRTVSRILNGQEEHPHETTRIALTAIFRKHNPEIVDAWFQFESPKRFEEYDQKADDSRVVFQLPNHAKNVANLRERLVGTYITYRYAFLPDWKVAREVLHIADDFQFSLSTKPIGAPDIQQFNGSVLPLGEPAGRVVNLVGIDSRPGILRARHLLFNDDYGLPDCKLALMLSTASQDLTTCVASTLLIKVAWDTKPFKDAAKLEDFMRSVTLIDAYDKVIHPDFGSGHDEMIREFLDNCPLGMRRGEKSDKTDPVLRLNQVRFRDGLPELRKPGMPDILKAVMGNGAIIAPFKDNWQAPSKAA